MTALYPCTFALPLPFTFPNAHVHPPFPYTFASSLPFTFPNATFTNVQVHSPFPYTFASSLPFTFSNVCQRPSPFPVFLYIRVAFFVHIDFLLPCVCVCISCVMCVDGLGHRSCVWSSYATCANSCAGFICHVYGFHVSRVSTSCVCVLMRVYVSVHVLKCAYMQACMYRHLV
jgi:hypothetical protein